MKKYSKIRKIKERRRNKKQNRRASKEANGRNE